MKKSVAIAAILICVAAAIIWAFGFKSYEAEDKLSVTYFLSHYDRLVMDPTTVGDSIPLTVTSREVRGRVEGRNFSGESVSTRIEYDRLHFKLQFTVDMTVTGNEHLQFWGLYDFRRYPPKEEGKDAELGVAAKNAALTRTTPRQNFWGRSLPEKKEIRIMGLESEGLLERLLSEEARKALGLPPKTFEF